jgi:hypothetical protein
LAIEPSINAARILAAMGARATRNGSATPTVFCTMPLSSAKIGDAGLA